MTDRGVSEVMGFVLVFALVTGTIGIVFATGFTGLESTQNAEHLRNVERAFDVLADNVGDLSTSEAPSRATEISLAGGSLTLGEPVIVDIYAENTTDSTDNATYSVNIDPIVYEGEAGTEIVYAGGAVLRAESGGAVMLREPDWIVGSRRSVLPLVNTGGSPGGVAGGTVLVVAQRDSKTLGEPLDSGAGADVNVSVTVESSRVGAWTTYFESAGYTAIDDDTTDDSVTYYFLTDSVYVPRNNVRVSFNR